MNSLVIESPSLGDEALPKFLSRLELECLNYTWTPQQWSDFLNSHKDNSKLYVVKNSNEPIGLLLFQLNPWSKQAHLLKIGLKPSSRGSGAASALFKIGKTWLAGNGFNEIFLEVGVNNGRAVGFYRKSGFTELCVKKQFYSDGADALAMLLPL